MHKEHNENENDCCVPCKLRPILHNKLEGVFLEMSNLFDKENEKMDVSFVYHELVGWALEQLAMSSASDDELKDYVYKDMKASFDLIIGQREIPIKGEHDDE